MTIHAAKGLEFPVVFVGGVEETIFPSGLSINTREELEEERRLFYVAVTRAKHKLWLTYANSRYRFGNLVQNEPSRFLEELPDEHVDRSYSGGGSRNSNLSNMGSAFARMLRGFGEDNYSSNVQTKSADTNTKPSYLPPKPSAAAAHIPTPNFIPSDTSNLQAGQKVEHQKFGFGEVTKMEGSAHNPIATVKFETNGEKKIMLNYAKLMIIQQ